MSKKIGRGFVCLACMAAMFCAAMTVRPAWGGPSPTKVYWTGAQDEFWNTTSEDWLLFGNPSDYSDGDDAFFQDAPGKYDVSLVGTLGPAQIWVDNDLLSGVGNLPGGTTADAADGGNYVFLGTGNIGAVGSSLIKTGGGSLTFANTTANLYTGSTAIYDGTLAVDLSTAVPTNLLSASSPLVMSGGTLSMLAASTGNSSQTFNGTQILSGSSEIINNGNGGTGSTLNLGAISRVSGGTVDFSEPTPATSVITTNNTPVNGILGGWATINNADWATTNGSGDIVALSSYTNDTWAPGNNTTVTRSSTLAANSTTNSLHFGIRGGFTITLTGTLNTINTGGILVSPSAIGVEIIDGSQLTAGTSPDLIVFDNNSSGFVNIGSQIVDNAPSITGVTDSGTGGDGGALKLTNSSNTYSGVTTISNGDIYANKLSLGGQPSSIGASSNAASNLVLDGGVLTADGSGDTTDRLFTLGPQGGAIAGYGVTFSNPGPVAFEETQASNGFASAVTFSLDGGSTSQNTFAPMLKDPGVGQDVLNLIQNGSTWTLTNSNTYSGGTTVYGGTLVVSNAVGSATGTGPVVADNQSLSSPDEPGTIGGGGAIGGPVTINNGAVIAPSVTVSGGATNLTINNSLTLNSGAKLTYDLNTAGIPNEGPTGGNDLITVTGNATIGTNIPVGVNPGASFGAGIYPLIQYGSLTNNSGGFSGWSVDMLSVPPGFGAGQYETFSFSNDVGNKSVDLSVAVTGTTPTLPIGNSTTIVQQANTTINNSAINNPVVNILGGPGGNGGAGGPGNTGFYVARGTAPVAKAFSFGWIPLVFQLPPGTPYFASSGIQVGDPAKTGIPISPNAPYTTNPPFNPPGTGQVSIGGNVVGAIYPAGTNPTSAAPDDWLPAYYLAPLIVVADPPATPQPTYWGESYSNPNGLTDIYLADQVGGEDELPGMLDADGAGADDNFDYQGSFLSLVQSDFPSITDLSQLDDAQWLEFDGSYGVDPINDIAWSVDDVPNADYTVVGVGLPEPGSLSLLAIASAGLMARRGRVKRA